MASEPHPPTRAGGRANLLAAAGALLLVLGCAASAPHEGLGPEVDFLEGKRLYEEKRYLRAAEVLEAFRYEHPGSDRVDDAIYYLARSHQGAGENLLAREEFQRLLRDFPQTSHREEAEFELAMSWMADARRPSLDPEPTQAALEALRTYLRHYPDGAYAEEASRYAAICLDRLAEKAYQNGRTYMKLNRPRAAVIYFEKSLEIQPRSSRTGEVLLELGRAQERLEESEAAAAAYRRLLEYADDERVKEESGLSGLRNQARQALARLGRTGEGSL